MADESNQLCAAWQHEHFGSFARDVRADIARYLSKSPEDDALGNGFKRRLSAFLTPELQCLTLYRLSHYCHVVRWRCIGSLLAKLNFVLFKISLPASSCIGPGCRLSHPAGVIFCGNAGSGLTLFAMAMCYDSSGSGSYSDSLTMANNVTVGAHAVVIGPISVGAHTKISPRAVLCQDTKEHTIVASTALYPVARSRKERA